jgi:POT family proton-dependent oligopeptide transporter
MSVNGFKDISLWDEGDWTVAVTLGVFVLFLIGGAMIAAKREPEALGHPKGLYMLFFAEMWERFSYYGMRALLIFYLTQHWLFNDAKSNLIYGAYTSLVYITPVLGGYLADRYLGQRRAVLFGGILLMTGHFLMAVEGTGGQGDPTINVFWSALAFIIVGSGFLKANISVMVGQLYGLTDTRRDPAYTIFYMGINLGAAAGTILVGYLGTKLGWAYGFGLAGIGMLAGLIVFVLGRKTLRGAGEAPKPLPKHTEWILYAVGLGAVAVIWGLIQFQDVIGNLLGIFGALLLGYVLIEAVFKMPYGSLAAAPSGKLWTMLAGIGFIVFYFLSSWFGLVTSATATSLPWFGEISTAGLLALVGVLLVLFVLASEKLGLEHHPRDRIYAILFLIGLNPVFWGLFEQAGGSINLYTDRFVEIGGVPAPIFQSINPIYILLLAPIFTAIWTVLGKRNMEPSAPAKFALALFQVGAGFLVFVWGANTFPVGEEAKTAVLFVFLLYLLHTTGELCLSPVGLSAMNRLAPGFMASLIMGAWFYMTAVGNFVAGKIGEATGGHGGEMTQGRTLEVYELIGWVAIGVGVVVLALSPFVKRWMHLDTIKDVELAGREELAEPAAAGMHPDRESKPAGSTI